MVNREPTGEEAKLVALRLGDALVEAGIQAGNLLNQTVLVRIMGDLLYRRTEFETISQVETFVDDLWTKICETTVDAIVNEPNHMWEQGIRNIFGKVGDRAKSLVVDNWTEYQAWKIETGLEVSDE